MSLMGGISLTMLPCLYFPFKGFRLITFFHIKHHTDTFSCFKNVCLTFVTTWIPEDIVLCEIG